ncbi:MAG: PQQ-binding-like beta-propeller repeat protein [Candidatus Korobacteraceae bacterium]
MPIVRAVFFLVLAGFPVFLPAQQNQRNAEDETPREGQITGRPGYPPSYYNPGREGFGAGTFGDYCATCHGNPAVERAPHPSVIKQMPPERIYAALTTGSMKEMAKDLSDLDKRGIAEFMSGRRLGASGSGDAASMSNRCSARPALRAQRNAPVWNGWSPDASNTRYQSAKAAGLTAAEMPKLKLKWAFGIPAAMSMYAQPSFFDGRVFVGSDNGHMYALDAASGCVYWSFQAKSGIRSAAAIGPVAPGSSKYAAFFGDVHGNAYAVDAQNGELLWTVSTDAHPLARITAAPVLHERRVYVPVTVLEEVESRSRNYACCSGRGALVALDAQTGKQIWKTYTIQETPGVIKKTSKGKEIFGPSGAGIWNTPTLDPKRRAIYFGTGNGFTGYSKTSDAILAVNMDTGKMLWTFQATKDDIWHSGCPRTEEQFATAPEDCAPLVAAPDWDFSASPILAKRADGREMLVAGQKSGVVWGLDPEKGTLIWKFEQPEGRGRMGILFGGAADDQNAYFNSRGGIFAVQLSSGSEKWFTPIPAPTGGMKSHPGASAAVSAIAGVAFSVGLDGMIRALGANDGKLLWEYNTVREFETVNGVKAKGGSMGSGGVAVANGTIIVASGYIGFQNGAPGNVVLAFAPAE